jgi:hypothetical protein
MPYGVNTEQSEVLNAHDTAVSRIQQGVIDAIDAYSDARTQRGEDVDDSAMSQHKNAFNTSVLQYGSWVETLGLPEDPSKYYISAAEPPDKGICSNHMSVCVMAIPTEGNERVSSNGSSSVLADNLLLGSRSAGLSLLRVHDE